MISNISKMKDPFVCPRGHSHLKVTGLRLPTHQIKGLSVKNFLYKRGSLSDRSKNGGSLGVKLHKIWAVLTIFFLNFCCDLHNLSNLIIFLENFD